LTISKALNTSKSSYFAIIKVFSVSFVIETVVATL